MNADAVVDVRREVFERVARGELLAPADMMVIFGLKHSQFATLNHQGAFDRFKTAGPPIGRRCFSGVLVQRHLNGDPLSQSTFGKRSARV